MGLRKEEIVTFIPAIAGREYEAASLVCTPVAPPGSGGESPPPPPPLPPPGAYVPPSGTPIVLETPDGLGGYTLSESIAPAPIGYVCRLQSLWVFYPGQTTPAKQYSVVCTGS